MAIDVGKFLRLQGAIKAAMDAVPVEHAAVAGNALRDAYDTLRAEVRAAIDDSLHEEFDRLFPSNEGKPRAQGGPGNLLGNAAAANEDRARLGQMAGWLDGLVQQARMQMEAQAYAEAKIREDRKLGFGNS